jgi:hypothetical protein
MTPERATASLMSKAGQMPETSCVEGFSDEVALIWSIADLLYGDERSEGVETAFEAARQWEQEQG